MQSRVSYKNCARGLHAQTAALLACVFGVLGYSTARAEMTEVSIVRQFGIHYLPLVIMEHERLVEKASITEGLKELRVTWAQLSGGTTVNDALLANAVQLSAGGVGPLLVLWDRTKDSRGDVKALAAVSDVPMTLTTRNPNIKSITDFTENDKIAMPAVKTSMQTVTLQMAAAIGSTATGPPCS